MQISSRERESLSDEEEGKIGNKCHFRVQMMFAELQKASYDMKGTTTCECAFLSFFEAQ